MRKFNFHTHSLYCDGKSGLREIVEEAIRNDFAALGFSSHAPLPMVNSYALSFEQFQNYLRELEKLRQEFHPHIRIYKSLEIDYIPSVSFPFEAFRKQGLDYTIGGVHLVEESGSRGLWFIDGSSPEPYDRGLRELFGGDIRKAVRQFFHQSMEMLATQKPDIIAHFDKIKMHNKGRFFDEQDTWYQKLVKDLLRLIKEQGTIVEMNTRGLYKKRFDDWFPSRRWVKEMKNLGIPLTISTDAHHKDELDACFEQTQKMLVENGIKTVMVFGENAWEARPLDEKKGH